MKLICKTGWPFNAQLELYDQGVLVLKSPLPVTNEQIRFAFDVNDKWELDLYDALVDVGTGFQSAMKSAVGLGPTNDNRVMLRVSIDHANTERRHYVNGELKHVRGGPVDSPWFILDWVFEPDVDVKLASVSVLVDAEKDMVDLSTYVTSKFRELLEEQRAGLNKGGG